MLRPSFLAAELEDPLALDSFGRIFLGPPEDFTHKQLTCGIQERRFFETLQFLRLLDSSHCPWTDLFLARDQGPRLCTCHVSRVARL